MAPRTFMSLKPGMPKPALPASKAAAPAAPGALAGKKPATTAAGEKADASLAETPQKTIVLKAKNIRGKPADSSAAQALDATASSLPTSKPAGALIAKKKENEAPDNLETVTTSPAPHTTLPDDTGSTRAAELGDQQDTTATKEDGTPCVSSKKAHGKGFGGSFSDVPNKVEVTKRAVKPLAIKAKATVPAAKETGAERLAAIVGPSKGEKKTVVVPAALKSSLPKGTKLKIGAPIKPKDSPASEASKKRSTPDDDSFEVRGVCSLCNKNVTTDDSRLIGTDKDDEEYGKYFHTKCVEQDVKKLGIPAEAAIVKNPFKKVKGEASQVPAKKFLPGPSCHKDSAPKKTANKKKKDGEFPVGVPKVKKTIDKKEKAVVTKTKKEKKAEYLGPKRPLAGYMIFSQEARPIILAENPKIAVTEIAKQIGAKWQELDEDGKQPYNDKAGILKAEYLVKLEEFEKANPEQARTATKKAANKEGKVKAPREKKIKEPKARKTGGWTKDIVAAAEEEAEASKDAQEVADSFMEVDKAGDEDEAVMEGKVAESESVEGGDEEEEETSKDAAEEVSVMEEGDVAETETETERVGDKVKEGGEEEKEEEEGKDGVTEVESDGMNDVQDKVEGQDVIAEEEDSPEAEAMEEEQVPVMPGTREASPAAEEEGVGEEAGGQEREDAVMEPKTTVEGEPEGEQGSEEGGDEVEDGEKEEGNIAVDEQNMEEVEEEEEEE